MKEYVERISNDSKKIYYAAGESIDKIKMMPQVENMIEKGNEVLFFNDYLDEFTIKAMNGYNDLTFCNVQDEHEDTEDDEETKKANEDNKDILNVIKETLNIKDVKFSDNLRNHPVSLTTTGDISLEMEKVLKAMPNNEGVKAEKVMMINKNHPIYDKLISLYNKDDNKELKDYSKVLYNMALLINGLSIENPNELSEIVCDMISK